MTSDVTLKDYLHFVEEFVDQQPDSFMVSLDVDSLFNNIPLERTIEISTNELFKESETIKGLRRSEVNELLHLATRDLHFIFDGSLYKQVDSVDTCPPPPSGSYYLFSLPQKIG